MATYSYEVETYATFLNVDETILKLNPLIEPLGYKFVAIELADLEATYGDLFYLPSKRTLGSVNIGGVIVSQDFEKALQRQYNYLHQLLAELKLFMLKKVAPYLQDVIDDKVDIAEGFKHSGAIQTFSYNLIKQLQLLKNDGIFVSTIFQFDTSCNRVVSRLTGNIINVSINKYTLLEADIDYLNENFSIDFQPSKLTKLALDYYSLSCGITTTLVKYVMLMTCLESIFNQGKDQIAHTIARHLSLVVSADKLDFQKNYARIKKLYHFRSTIVHGDTPNEDMHSITDELQTLVRKAMLYCLHLNYSKDDLFKELNAKGF